MTATGFSKRIGAASLDSDSNAAEFKVLWFKYVLSRPISSHNILIKKYQDIKCRGALIPTNTAGEIQALGSQNAVDTHMNMLSAYLYPTPHKPIFITQRQLNSYRLWMQFCVLAPTGWVIASLVFFRFSISKLHRLGKQTSPHQDPITMGLRRFQFVHDSWHHLAIVRAGRVDDTSSRNKVSLFLRKTSCVTWTNGVWNISQYFSSF